MIITDTISRPSLAFLSAVLCILIIGSGVDILVPSLPAMRHDLHTSSSVIGFAISIYLLSYGICQWFVGGLSDSFGRKHILIPSLVGYLLATLIISQTHSITVLLTMRCFQGMFAAGIAVVARVLLSDCYSGEQLSKKVASFIIFWGLAMIMSPYLGSHLQFWFGWHAVFLALATLTFITLLCAIFLLPETIAKKHPLSLKSILHGYQVILSNTNFIIGTIICGMCYAFVTIYNVLGPFIIQVSLKQSVLVYGHVALTLGSGWVLGSLLCRISIGSHIEKIKTCVTYTVFITTCLFILLALLRPPSFYLATVPVFLLILGGGFLFSYALGLCMKSFSERGATASAAMGGTFSLIVSGATSISSHLPTHTLAPLATIYLILGSTIALTPFLLRRSTR